MFLTTEVEPQEITTASVVEVIPVPVGITKAPPETFAVSTVQVNEVKISLLVPSLKVRLTGASAPL